MVKRITPLAGLALSIAGTAAALLLVALGFLALALIVSATVAASSLPGASVLDAARGIDILFDSALYAGLAGALALALAALVFGADRARHQIAAAATTRKPQQQAESLPEREAEVGGRR